MNFRLRKDVFFGVVFLVLFQVAVAFMTGIFSRWSVFSDPDEFMRAFRAMMLMQDGRWYEPLQLYVNPPYGLVQHWTRPDDVLVVLGAWPLSAFLPVRRAIEIWSSLLPVILHAVLLVGIVWAMKPWAGPRARIAVLFLFFAQLYILAEFHVGRIDHNPIYLAILPWIFGNILRASSGTGSLRHGAWAGFLSALAIWTCVESLVMVGAAAMFGGLAWFLRLSNVTRPQLVFACSLTGFMVVFGLVERGPWDFLSSIHELDRISLFHVSMAACLSVMWMLPEWWPVRLRSAEMTIVGRGLVGLFGILLVAVLVYFYQPQLLHGRVNAPDPLYNSLRVSGIAELKPIFSIFDPFNRSGLMALSSLLLPAIGFLFAGWRLVAPSTRTETRIFWLAVSVFFLCYFRSGIIPGKYAVYYQILGLFPLGVMVGEAADRLATYLGAASREMAASILSLGLIVVGTVVPMAVLPDGDATGGSRSSANAVIVNRLCSAQIGIPSFVAAMKGQTGRLMSIPDLAPVFLYAAGPGNEVLSIPNHRYQKGFEMTYLTLSAKDDADARRLFKESGANLLLLCANKGTNGMTALDRGRASFAGRLYSGASSPDWLEPLPLSDAARKEGFMAWKAK